MFFYTVATEKRRPLTALVGLLQGLAGLAIFWLGLCSCLVGLAYRQQQGYWMPFMVGTIMATVGLVLLCRGTVRVIRNVFTRPLPQGDDL
jgi:peptidoglycan/LPS O-acetylase OafA/YrhL